MKNDEYKALGVMSGTSLDGIDLALVKFKKNKHWKFEILTTQTIPYPAIWKKKLNDAIAFDDKKLKDLDQKYTRYLGHIIFRFIEENFITDLDIICSHGHTIKHEPGKGYTLQIGNLPELVEYTGKTLVCDFRVQDVRLGGQGAPLVPIGDELLFPEYAFCLNLGGFANVSTSSGDKRIAYDICPVNTVLNFYAEKLGYRYDAEGKIAASGELIPDLLYELDNLSFYHKSPPKSLGIEWVLSEVLPLTEKFKNNVPGILNTFCHHIANQISNNMPGDKASEVLVTGGGCHNSFLLHLLEKRSGTTLIIPDKKIIEFKEALIFGLLGVLRYRGEVNVLSSVTGAVHDHSSGKIYQV